MANPNYYSWPLGLILGLSLASVGVLIMFWIGASLDEADVEAKDHVVSVTCLNPASGRILHIPHIESSRVRTKINATIVDGITLRGVDCSVVPHALPEDWVVLDKGALD